MRKVLEKFIQRKNPKFQFDAIVTNRLLLSLVYDKTFSVLRGFFYYIINFKKPNVLILGKRVTFFNSRQIDLGKMVKIDDNAFISALGTGGVRIGDNTSIGAYSRIEISTTFNDLGKYILIGNHVGLGQFACLGGAGGLTIGDNCIIGPYLSCHPENHNFDDSTSLIKHQGVSRKGISIGQNCWIGAKVTILDGVTIGDNSVIAAGAVVNKSMPANSVIAGVPARVIKSIEPSMKLI